MQRPAIRGPSSSSVQHGWRSVTGPLTILAAWECVRCTLAVDRPYEAYRRPYTKDRPEPWRSGKTVGFVDRRNSTQGLAVKACPLHVRRTAQTCTVGLPRFDGQG